MNPSISTFTALAGGVLLITALAASATAADPVPAAYSDQLGRCVAAVRQSVRDPATTSLTHVVTGVRAIGMSHEFTIHSTAFEAGGQPAHQYTARCLADPWRESATLQALRERG